ncbi:MAG: amidohydrolase family protein [Thermoplasmata archaeon]
MSYVEGWIFDNDDFFRGCITFSDEKIIEIFKSKPGKVARPKSIKKNELPIAKGIIIPTFVNSHTHSADTALRARVASYTGSLERLVAPPNGIKHRYLANASRNELISSIQTSISEMLSSGTYTFFDFREGGLDGIEIFKDAVKTQIEKSNINVNAYALSRPIKNIYKKEEVDLLLEHSIGLGLSSFVDWNEEEIKKVALHVKQKGKILGIHASERIRENIDKILDLSPTFLVHMLEASEEDLEKVAEYNIPIVICPRANAFFGKIPNIPLMLEKGILLLLGTDNSMLSKPDMFREVEFAFRICRISHFSKKSKKKVNPIEILKMAVQNPRRGFINMKMGMMENDKPDFIVINTNSEINKSKDCAGAIMHASKEDIILAVSRTDTCAYRTNTNRNRRLGMFQKSGNSRLGTC